MNRKKHKTGGREAKDIAHLLNLDPGRVNVSSNVSKGGALSDDIYPCASAGAAADFLLASHRIHLAFRVYMTIQQPPCRTFISGVKMAIASAIMMFLSASASAVAAALRCANDVGCGCLISATGTFFLLPTVSMWLPVRTATPFTVYGCGAGSAGAGSKRLHFRGSASLAGDLATRMAVPCVGMPMPVVGVDACTGVAAAAVVVSTLSLAIALPPPAAAAALSASASASASAVSRWSSGRSQNLWLSRSTAVFKNSSFFSWLVVVMMMGSWSYHKDGSGAQAWGQLRVE